MEKRIRFTPDLASKRNFAVDITVSVGPYNIWTLYVGFSVSALPLNFSRNSGDSASELEYSQVPLWHLSPSRSLGEECIRVSASWTALEFVPLMKLHWYAVQQAEPVLLVARWSDEFLYYGYTSVSL